MSNQAYSVSEDLMVGAGVLYFKRSDDPNGYHHLGNVDEFNITNDIEKIDKNSSMNKKRELMASVITSIKPTASITMTEYNPYNLALGLFGNEGVYNQVGTTLTNERYVVPSVPGIITLRDADGNRYMDVRNVVVTSSSASPATFTANANGYTATITNTGNSEYTDNAGGKITLDVGTWMSANPLTVYITIKKAPTATSGGDLDGMEVVYKVGTLGSTETVTISGSTLTHTIDLEDNGVAIGAQLTFTVSGSGNFTEFASADPSDPIQGLQPTLNAPISDYVAGKDYTVDDQELRAGIIKIKDGGNIKAGDTILVSALVPEKKYVTVNGGNAGDISGELLFIGDPNIGGQYNIEGWKVKITPEGDLTGLIGTEFGTFTLTIDFLSDYENHPECPYYRATMIGRASGDNSVTGTYDPKY